jgi:hypothetical protein
MKYKVVKEYCGIEKGTVINADGSFNIRHMVEHGYWEKIESIKRKKKIEKVDDRLKK